MATYLILANYTQKGAEGIKDRATRAERLRKRCADNGCELKGGYLSMGRYDLVLLIEAPDDLAVAKVVLPIGMLGIARTETLRLYDEAEFAQIAAGI